MQNVDDSSTIGSIIFNNNNNFYYSYISNSMQTNNIINNNNNNNNNNSNYQIATNLNNNSSISRNPLIIGNHGDIYSTGSTSISNESWLSDSIIMSSTSFSTTRATTTNSSAADLAAIRSLYFSIENKLAILPILLMIAGTFGNCLAFYVLTRRRLRNQSTMLYFAALTLMDTLALYQWNFNFFYKYKLNQRHQNLEEQSLFLCRYISFMAYFSMQTSAWILTAISIDRYLIVTNHNWKQKYSRSIKYNLIFIGIIVGTFALINSPVTVLNGVPSKKKNVKIECYTTWYMEFWQKFSLLLECIFPLSLMIIFNYLLIKRTLKSSTKLRASDPSAASSLGAMRSVQTASNLNLKKKSHSSFSLTRDEPMSEQLNGSGVSAAAAATRRFQLNASSFNDLSSNNDSKLKRDRSELYSNTSSAGGGAGGQGSSWSAEMVNPATSPTTTTPASPALTNSRKKLTRPKLIVPKLTTVKSAASNLGGVSSLYSSASSFKQQQQQRPAIGATRNGDSSPPFIVVKTLDDEEKMSKLTSYKKACDDLDSEHEKFEAMVNSISGSFSNLEFLNKQSRERLATSNGGGNNSVDIVNDVGITDNNSGETKKHHSSLTVSASNQSAANNKLSIQLGVTGASNAELSSLGYRPSICDNKSFSGVFISRSAGGDVRRRVSYNRNRRIVVMLSLLTISFAISTLPSAIFYTFFRSKLNDKPYRRLLSMCFNCIRHLSHAFNFIIYFTSSTVIKQQLAETFSSLRSKNLSWFLYFNYITCCGCFKNRVEYIEAKKRQKMKRELKQATKKKSIKAHAEPDLTSAACTMDPEYEMNFMRKTDNVRQLYAYSAQHEKPSVLREISFISIDASTIEADTKPTAATSIVKRTSIAVAVSNEIEVSTVHEDDDDNDVDQHETTTTTTRRIEFVKRHEMTRASTTASNGDGGVGGAKKRSIQLRRKTTCGSQIGRSVSMLKKDKRSADAVGSIGDDNYNNNKLVNNVNVNKNNGGSRVQVKNSTNIKTISFNVPKLKVNSKEISKNNNKNKRLPLDWF